MQHVSLDRMKHGKSTNKSGSVALKLSSCTLLTTVITPAELCELYLSLTVVSFFTKHALSSSNDTLLPMQRKGEYPAM